MKNPHSTKISATAIPEKPSRLKLRKRNSIYWLPVSGNWPFSIFRFRNKLTSGSMCVKQVVRITPPPKHERAEMSICPLGVALWPILQHLLSNTGSIPRNKEMPPNRSIEMILACIVSILNYLGQSKQRQKIKSYVTLTPHLILQFECFGWRD